MYICDRLHLDARWIGGLTKVVIYPIYAIHCKRLWSMPAPNCVRAAQGGVLPG